MKPLAGVSEADARARQHAEGHNELPQPDRRTPFRIAIEVLREPMLALLLVGGIVYLVLGDLKEAIILLAFATMSIVITVVQETRTERVLEALRDLTSPRALVIRDGRAASGSPAARSCAAISSCWPRVTGSRPTPCSLQCQDLQADESLLTGESVPVRKVAWDDRRPVRSPAAGRRRPAVCVFWFAGGARLRHWRGYRDRPAKRNRQDRPIAEPRSKPNRRACRRRPDALVRLFALSAGR